MKHQKAFTLLELTVVSMLMTLLALLLSSTWVGVGQTAVGLIGRSQLVQERDLAVAALSRDLGGGCAESDGRLGEKVNGRWLSWEKLPNVDFPTNQDLILTYDGGTDDKTTEVRYLVAKDPDPNVSTLILVRRTKLSGIASTDFTVARNVYSMAVPKPEPPDYTEAQIVICFIKYRTLTLTCDKYRTLTLMCDLTAKAPSVSSATPLDWKINHYSD